MTRGAAKASKHLSVIDKQIADLRAALVSKRLAHRLAVGLTALAKIEHSLAIVAGAVRT